MERSDLSPVYDAMQHGIFSSSLSLAEPPTALLRGATLFLDFDGTLVALADRPESVVVDERVPAVLATLADRLDGRLAIVSGRPASQIVDYLGDAIAIAGSHGAELRWPDGRVQAPASPGWIADAVARAVTLRHEHPGVFVETKPYGIAIHHRQAPGAAAATEAFARALAAERGLHVQPGKMVFELHEPGTGKGEAVRAFLADEAMAGTPVFIGDDLTDEAGFRAAVERGGHGILVGAPRDTAAGFRLNDVEATIRWLNTAADAIA